MNKLDWEPSNDEFLKKNEVSLHNFYHDQLAKSELTSEKILVLYDLVWKDNYNGLTSQNE